MPLVNARPVRFRPRSLADTLDGDNVASGACSSLVNLIKDPTTPACLQCRPAAIIKSSFSGFTTPGVVSIAYQVNNLIFGLVASGKNVGQDEPFCYDLIAGSFRTISGINSGNCPYTQSTSGDWTPPSITMVGTRIIVCHPGFVGLGSGQNVFGYFDVSSYNNTTNGNTTNGSNQITGNIPIAGIGPGYLISGTGISSGSTVLNAISVTPQSTGSTISGNPTITGVVSTAGFAPGQPIAGLGIPTSAVIVSIASGTITMSVNATATSSTPVTISATGTVITMSSNATVTASGAAITLAGGSNTTPLWCAGNTTNVPLVGIPTCVAQFNNRAYFSVGQYAIFCDALTLNISQATQALTIGDTAPITCLEPLTFINIATAAPVQGLLAFKENLINLITGDPTTDNLDNSNLSPAGIGTVSPSAVTATAIGVFFPATDGIRCVELSGTVSDPLPDVQVPIIMAINRTRMSGSYNNGVYRICLQSGIVSGSPFQEFWLDVKSKMWTGPHTFQQNLIVAWKATFIAFSNAYPAKLYQSDPVQNSTSTFTENGSALSWLFATAAQGDGDDDLLMNSIVLSTLNVAFKAGSPPLNFIATDANGSVIGQAIMYPPGASTYWYGFTWGSGSVWSGAQYGLQPRIIPWTAPVVFSKLILTVSAQSSLGFSISNFQAFAQRLSYPSTSFGDVS